MRESEVAQSCLTLSDPMDSSLRGSSVHGVVQARVLEWDAIAFSGLRASPTWVVVARGCSEQLLGRMSPEQSRSGQVGVSRVQCFQD